MKKIILYTVLFLLSITAGAQKESVMADSTTFKGHLVNKEYNVFIIFDFYKNNVIVPNQEIFGEIAGYFGDNQDARKWLFTSAEITSPTSATIEIINDYGSEDLTATLQKKNDSTYVLRQNRGSALKIARDRKWIKMPKELVFIKR